MALKQLLVSPRIKTQSGFNSLRSLSDLDIISPIAEAEELF